MYLMRWSKPSKKLVIKGMAVDMMELKTDANSNATAAITGNREHSGSSSNHNDGVWGFLRDVLLGNVADPCFVVFKS